MFPFQDFLKDNSLLFPSKGKIKYFFYILSYLSYHKNTVAWMTIRSSLKNLCTSTTTENASRVGGLEARAG